MAGPIVFISTSRLREGMLERFRALSKEMFPLLEETKPNTLIHYGYTNDDESELAFVHVFPDSDAMDAHFLGAEDRTSSVADYIDTYRYDVYGKPSEKALEMLSQDPGAALVVRSGEFGGYMRLDRH
jgi:hypothetical protein